MKTVVALLLLASIAQADSASDPSPSHQARRDRVTARAMLRAAQRRSQLAAQQPTADGWGPVGQSFSPSHPSGSQLRSVYTCSPVPGMGSFGFLGQ